MTYRRTGRPRAARRRTSSLAVGWVVAVAMVALVVGAVVGTLLTAVLIAAGRGQREGADAACPTCSSPVDRATGRSAQRSAPGGGPGASTDA